MATVDAGKSGDMLPPQCEETWFADGPDVVQQTSEESFPASDAPSWTGVTGVGSPWQEKILRQCGRFTLTRTAQGFCWILTSKCGFVWYWHPKTQEWIANNRAFPTEEEATAGLHNVLASEQAGIMAQKNELVEGGLPDRA